MKILITGANGQIGKFIGFEDEKVVRTDYETLDITDYKKVEKLIKKEKPKTIIHLAGFKSEACLKDLRVAWIVNVEATIRLAEIAQKYGCKRFIFISSSAVYDKTSYYGFTKLMAERGLMARFKGILVNLRLFNVYGEDLDSFIKKVQNDESVQVFKNTDRDYIHIADVVEIIKRAVKVNENATIDVGTGRTINSYDLYKMIWNKEPVNLVENEFSTSFADTSNLLKYIKYQPETDICV